MADSAKDRKARQEEALRRFLNIGCRLADFHQKSSSKRWTTPISPFLYQNIYPTAAPCGFACHGRHARCFDMYHMHLQTMHKKAWIQSCENRNKTKTLELTFFRENLRKESDGNLVVDMKKRPRTAPMTKRDTIVFRSDPPGALGMFPQYTNFVKPMRLIPRGGKQAADKSVHDSGVDFDNWDEMDELFSDSELQFSDDLDIEDEHHSIEIDPTYLYVEPDRRKTPPPPKERILKKHTTDLKVGSMDELPSTEEPPSTPPVSPDGIAAAAAAAAAAADSHPSEEVLGRYGGVRSAGPAGKKAGKSARGRKAARTREIKEYYQSTPPGASPGTSRYDAEESYDEFGEVRDDGTRRTWRGRQAGTGRRGGGRRQRGVEGEDDYYTEDYSYEDFEEVGEDGTRRTLRGRGRGRGGRQRGIVGEDDFYMEESYDDFEEVTDDGQKRVGMGRGRGRGRGRGLEESYDEFSDDKPGERKGRRGGRGGRRQRGMEEVDDESFDTLGEVGEKRTILKDGVRMRKSILKTGSGSVSGTEDDTTRSKKSLSIRFGEGLTEDETKKGSYRERMAASRGYGLDGPRQSWLHEFVERQSFVADDGVSEEIIAVSKPRRATTRTLMPFPKANLKIQNDRSEALRQMSRRQAERSHRKSAAELVVAPLTSVLSAKPISRIRISSVSSKSSSSRSSDSEEDSVSRASAMKMAEAAAQAASNAPVWMKAKLGLSMQASRFTVPLDIRVLQRMSPIEYVKTYCIVTPHRQELCTKIFSQFKAKGKPPVLHYDGLKGALQALFMQNMAKGDLDDIFSILSIDETVVVDEKLFASIAGFSERVLCPRMAAEESGAQRPTKNKLEHADLGRMFQRTNSTVVHPGVKKILGMLLEQLT